MNLGTTYSRDMQINGANPSNQNSVLSQIGSSEYNLREAVKLPRHENREEWIANNIFDFYKQICMLYETVEEYCTDNTCPRMTAGKKYEYLWSGPTRESLKYSAGKYIRRLLSWVQEQLNDENVFPTITENAFPPNYDEVCKTIAKRLCRVYAHVYHHHLHQVKQLKEEAHMNTSFKHFIYFVKEFKLVPDNDLDPLNDYINNLT